MRAGKVHPTTIPVAKPVRVGPEHNAWYWHPNRVGATSCPSDFAKQLAEVDPDLACHWNPVEQRWQLWMRKPSLQNPICQGWMLLFPVHPKHGLDARVLARLYGASARRWGNGKRYFEAVEREILHDKAVKEATWDDQRNWMARDYFKHTQIQVSGCGESRGNKFTP